MDALKTIYYLLMLTALLVLLIRSRKLDVVLQIYAVILCSAIATEKVHDIMNPNIVGVYIYHIYHLLELLLLSSYYFLISQQKRNKQIILAGTVLYVCYFMYEYLLVKGNFYTYKKPEVLLADILIPVYSVLYLLELYRKTPPIVLKTYPHFWVVLGNLLYFSGSVFFSGYVYVLLKTTSEKLYSNLTLIPVSLNYVLYLLYTIGFLCPTRKTISS